MKDIANILSEEGFFSLMCPGHVVLERERKVAAHLVTSILSESIYF